MPVAPTAIKSSTTVLSNSLLPNKKKKLSYLNSPFHELSGRRYTIFFKVPLIRRSYPAPIFLDCFICGSMGDVQVRILWSFDLYNNSELKKLNSSLHSTCWKFEPLKMNPASVCSISTNPTVRHNLIKTVINNSYQSKIWTNSYQSINALVRVCLFVFYKE